MFEQGQLPQALEICINIIQGNPRHVEALHIAGIIESQLGQHEQAQVHLSSAVKLQPKNHWVHSNLSLVYLRLEQLDEAKRHGKKAVSLDPGFADAWNNLGNVYRANDKYDDALEAYSKAIKLFGQNPEVLCNMGSVFEEQDREDEAIANYRKVIANAPDFARAYNQLGLLYKKRGDLKGAVQVFENGLSQAPSDVDMLNNLGLVYRQQDNKEKAAEYFSRAIKVNSNYAGAYQNLADLQVADQDLVSAEPNYLAALSHDPGLKEASLHLANLYLELNDYDKAEKYYLQTLALDETYLGAVLGYANSYIKQEAWEQALECLDQAEKLDPACAEVFIRRASLYTDQAKYDKAVEEVERALEIDGAELAVHAELLDIHSHFGAWDKAEQTIKTIHAIAPQNITMLFKIAGYYEKQHDLARARKIAEEVLEIKSDNKNARFLVAKLNRREKNYTEALSLVSELEPAEDCVSPFCSQVLFEKGAILDKTGRYDEAFPTYQQAAKIRGISKNALFNLDRIKANFTIQERYFSKEKLVLLPHYQPTEEERRCSPIFVVGHPRSGTTLLEQILVSHPNISAGDELVFIRDIIQNAKEDLGADKGYPAYLDNMSESNADELIGKWRRYYLHRAKELGVGEKGKNRFTDKMPLNLTNLPMIRMIFPDAPIIHIVRHPMDSCLSSMFSGFAHGHEWCNDIVDAARYYKEMTALVTHLKKNMKMNYLEVRYEDLVDDQEFWSRKVIDFVGEPWDDNCLQFHKTKRLARTASYEQVTQKIYTSSRLRYKNYEKHLQEPLEILRSTIQAYGYEI